jgi:hypothetical protein
MWTLFSCLAIGRSLVTCSNRTFGRPASHCPTGGNRGGSNTPLVSWSWSLNLPSPGVCLRMSSTRSEWQAASRVVTAKRHLGTITARLFAFFDATSRQRALVVTARIGRNQRSTVVEQLAQTQPHQPVNESPFSTDCFTSTRQQHHMASSRCCVQQPLLLRQQVVCSNSTQAGKQDHVLSHRKKRKPGSLRVGHA